MIEKFKIQSEFEANSYLTDFLAEPKNRNMTEVEHRSIELIEDSKLRAFFLTRAREILGS